MAFWELIGLAAAAAAAGAINAVAGGGTLLTFPALLAAGTSPVVANATSTLALLLGTTGSLFGYRRHLATVRHWLIRFIPVSVLGGFLGSLLLTCTTDRVFARLVPFLLLFATVLFLTQGLLRSLARSRTASETPAVPSPRWIAGTIVFQFGVALYGGYFGAGIGILMLASLGCLGLTNIHEMNTVKTVLGSLINVVAAAWFIVSGLIHWPRAAVMTAGALGGYYLGSHFAQRIPQLHVRRIIAGIGLILSAVAFYREFLT